MSEALDISIAKILAQLPAPPTNDGAALHSWAMEFGRLAQQAQAGWISVKDRLPAFGRVVPVTLFAGRIGNPSHPGYPGNPWIECSKILIEGQSHFECEVLQTGRVTHWLDVEAAPQQGGKTAADSCIQGLRNVIAADTKGVMK